MTFAVDNSNSAARNLKFGTAPMVPQGLAVVGKGWTPMKAEDRMKKKQRAAD
jgi:hypothetical protein